MSIVAVAGLAWIAAPAAGQTPALGSPAFEPSSQRPVGWRGDWTGRFPGATPPLTWDRKRVGDGYEVKNIVWSTKLPDFSVASPIVVGDRIFVCSEPWDLMCLDKKTGAILWIRSATEYDGLTDEDRKALPDCQATFDPLVADLAAANDAIAKALNGAVSPSGVSDSQRTAIDKLVAGKKALHKRIYDTLVKLDKKKFERYWAQGPFGFAGQTPVTDGKQVYVFLTTGITAAYDMAGNREWIALGKGTCSEHGNFASPVLMGGKVIVWAAETRAYDAATGALAWKVPGISGNTYGSLFPLKVGGEDVAAFQSGFFVRVSDGKELWGKQLFGDCVATPIVEEGKIFTWIGYPRNAQGLGFKSYTIPENVDAKLAVDTKFTINWADGELPIEDKRHTFDRGYVASPLYVDGLIYQVSQGGGLTVNDAKTGELVYRKVLDMKPRTNYWDWAGASASPTLAGKHIYLMDNQGLALVIEPGREYKEVARNMLENMAGKSQEQNLASPFFDGARMYYRTPEYLYCIGEK